MGRTFNKEFFLLSRTEVNGPVRFDPVDEIEPSPLPSSTPWVGIDLGHVRVDMTPDINLMISTTEEPYYLRTMCIGNPNAGGVWLRAQDVCLRPGQEVLFVSELGVLGDEKGWPVFDGRPFASLPAVRITNTTGQLNDNI